MALVVVLGWNSVRQVSKTRSASARRNDGGRSVTTSPIPIIVTRSGRRRRPAKGLAVVPDRSLIGLH
jgi:hypothetical protein